MENRVECALKPSGYACHQGRANNASNDVFTKPTQDAATHRGDPLLAPLPIYRPPPAAFSHRSVPGAEGSLPNLLQNAWAEVALFHFTATRCEIFKF
jgi:hypothetical protein